MSCGLSKWQRTEQTVLGWQAQQAAALDAEPGMGHHNTEALDPKLAADGSSESSGADGTANGKGYEGDMDKWGPAELRLSCCV